MGLCWNDCRTDVLKMYRNLNQLVFVNNISKFIVKLLYKLWNYTLLRYFVRPSRDILLFLYIFSFPCHALLFDSCTVALVLFYFSKIKTNVKPNDNLKCQFFLYTNLHIVHGSGFCFCAPPPQNAGGRLFPIPLSLFHVPAGSGRNRNGAKRRKQKKGIDSLHRM